MNDDYIALEIARGRMQSIVDEAGAALLRTAFSKLIRESKDFACSLLTSDGATVVQSSQSIPVFLGTVPRTVAAFLASPIMADLREGDVIATNDPWLGTGQLQDLTIAAPIFVEGNIVAFAAVTADLSDMGGRGYGPDAPDMYQEGLRLPIVKLASAWHVEGVIADIISANVRRPREALGDINAMLNAASVMSERLRSLSDEISVDRFRRICLDLEARTDAYMRQAIQALPDGTYRASLTSEVVVSAPFTINLALTVAGDEIMLDFDGSSPQVPFAINSPYGYTRSYAVYALKCVLAPKLPFNDGVLKSISVKAPEASIVNSAFPAAGTARSIVGHFIPSVIYDALSDCIPERVIAQSGAPRPTVHVRGEDDSGERFHALFAIAGGMGARSTKDGLSCVNFPTNTYWIPIEVVEAECPLVFEEKEFIPSSGGKGQFRGGLGQQVSLRFLVDSVEARVTAQWLRTSPKGVRGGEAGNRAEVLVNGRPCDEVSSFPLGRGDVLTIRTPGGGGFGPSAARSPADHDAELLDGYVAVGQ